MLLIALVFLYPSLDCSCSSNEAAYKALIIGLTAALQNGILRLSVQGDLRFIVKQVN